MVQILEKEELEKVIIIIPEEEEKVGEKLDKKAIKEIKKKSEKKEAKRRKQAKLAKHAKYNQELICVNKLKNKLDAQIYRSKNIAF
ncbi:MAG: hypothetical protein ACFE9T_00715 [Promethearchaeota archaeon]